MVVAWMLPDDWGQGKRACREDRLRPCMQTAHDPNRTDADSQTWIVPVVSVSSLKTTLAKQSSRRAQDHPFVVLDMSRTCSLPGLR